MDVVRLGERYSSEYVPDMLIEGYSNMIFTERFPDPGDFELTTPKIAETWDALPPDTLISHLDTDDVHIVETRNIELDDFGRPVLKITGTSLTTLTNDRWIEAKHGKKRKMARKNSRAGAAAVLLYQAFDNASGVDVTRAGDFSWNTLDRIPNVSITDSCYDLGNSVNNWLTEGILDTQLREIMKKSDIGLRMIRPSANSNGQVVTVTANPLDDRGKVVRTQTNGITSLRFDIYQGVDKTGSVKFRTLHGDLEKIQYLNSRKGYKNGIEIISSIGGKDIYRDGTSGDSGIKRRIGFVDAGEPDTDPEPERPKDPRDNATAAEMTAYRKALTKWRDDWADWKVKYDADVAEFKADYESDAARLLKDTSEVLMLSGDISPEAPYRFKTDYNLGDKVTLLGDYGIAETMVVSEYIWTEDSKGDRGYPGLTLP